MLSYARQANAVMEGLCAYLSALGDSKKQAATRRSFLDGAVEHLATPRVS
jgi:hypothetical protein